MKEISGTGKIAVERAFMRLNGVVRTRTSVSQAGDLAGPIVRDRWQHQAAES